MRALNLNNITSDCIRLDQIRSYLIISYQDHIISDQINISWDDVELARSLCGELLMCCHPQESWILGIPRNPLFEATVVVDGLPSWIVLSHRREMLVMGETLGPRSKGFDCVWLVGYDSMVSTGWSIQSRVRGHDMATLKKKRQTTKNKTKRKSCRERKKTRRKQMNMKAKKVLKRGGGGKKSTSPVIFDVNGIWSTASKLTYMLKKAARLFKKLLDWVRVKPKVPGGYRLSAIYYGRW